MSIVISENLDRTAFRVYIPQRLMTRDEMIELSLMVQVALQPVSLNRNLRLDEAYGTTEADYEV